MEATEATNRLHQEASEAFDAYDAAIRNVRLQQRSMLEVLKVWREQAYSNAYKVYLARMDEVAQRYRARLGN